MGGGESSDGQCSNTKPYSCPVKIKILVVDDDQIALTIVSTMLRRNDHQVFTARDPLEALSTLRERPGFFNLVITDFHMPHMNGSELQRQIDIEFKLPVVMMSSDDKESTVVQSLRNGAVFFLVKPVKQEDLKDIWQYALSVKKGKSILVEESGSLQIGESSATTVSRGDEHNALGNKLQSGDNNPPSREQDKCDSSSETSNDKNPRKNCKQKGKRSKDDRDDFDHTYLAATKKAKVVWTNSLHTRFLQAIRFIGLDKAVPKRILEFMCVPGLTRENVASHLQKYRMFLRRVAEKTASQTFGEQIMKSSFAYGHEFASSGVAQGYARSIVEQRRQALARYYGGQQVQAGTPYNFSQRASSSNPRSQSSYGQPNQCYNASSSNPKSQFSYGQPNQYYNGGQIFSNTTNYWDSQRQGIMANFESSLSSGDTSFGLMGSVGSLNNSQHTFAQPQDAGIVSSSMAPYNNGYYNGMMGASNSSIGSQFPTKNYNYAGLGVGSNGGLTINGQSLSGSTSNGNTSFGFGVGSSQAGFLFNNDGDQDDNDFDMMNDNSFALDNMINMHLMGLTLDDDDAFVDQFINYQMPPPNQGGYPNPNLSSSSSYNGQNPSVNQLRSVDFLSLGNEGQDSWGGQMLSQLESGGQVMSSMKNGTNPTLNKAGSYDVFGYQSPRDQGNRSRQVLNSGQIRMDPTTSEASSLSRNQLTYDQEWDYELLEAFLRGDHA